MATQRSFNTEPRLEMSFKDNCWVASCAGHELKRFKKKANCCLYLFDSAKDDVSEMAAALGIQARTLVRRWDKELRERVKAQAQAKI
ncbi:hypothetical protein [Allobaculum sp. Allo2]|uniref:hypothetical protein n=2 Tax=Allobaculum TaxID=174708 RepID=UPI001F615F2E|nr:hypothetical protein [Allobaculum sp. Allo2]UNT92222.1 hypothetical protein KWG61_08285 [Allobaculum sp. Allo2]